ncbi:hypothetical protein BC829DRAFT_419883 [Chytridium lagenaria]|nr:hypothetical protein BC829DRAFT_419883 [Chytridium lagenaria]
MQFHFTALLVVVLSAFAIAAPLPGAGSGSAPATTADPEPIPDPCEDFKDVREGCFLNGRHKPPRNPTYEMHALKPADFFFTLLLAPPSPRSSTVTLTMTNSQFESVEKFFKTVLMQANTHNRRHPSSVSSPFPFHSSIIIKRKRKVEPFDASSRKSSTKKTDGASATAGSEADHNVSLPTPLNAEEADSSLGDKSTFSHPPNLPGRTLSLVDSSRSHHIPVRRKASSEKADRLRRANTTSGQDALQAPQPSESESTPSSQMLPETPSNARLSTMNNAAGSLEVGSGTTSLAAPSTLPPGVPASRGNTFRKPSSTIYNSNRNSFLASADDKRLSWAQTGKSISRRKDGTIAGDTMGKRETVMKLGLVPPPGTLNNNGEPIGVVGGGFTVGDARLHVTNQNVEQVVEDLDICPPLYNAEHTRNQSGRNPDDGDILSRTSSIPDDGAIGVTSSDAHDTQPSKIIRIEPSLKPSEKDALVLGCLEAFIVWSLWKFGSLAWEKRTGGSQFILVYLSLFIFAQAVLALGVFDAAWNKNSMQVIAGTLFSIAIFAYSIIQNDQIVQYRNCAQNFLNVWSSGALTTLHIIQDARGRFFMVSADAQHFHMQAHCPWNLLNSNITKDTDQNVAWKLIEALELLDRAWPVQVAISAISGIGNVIGALLAYKAYQAYGWNIYQVQGASVSKRQMLERYHVFILMLKGNIYFTIGIVAMVVSASYYVQRSDYDQQDQLNILLFSANATEHMFKHVEAPRALATSFILPSAIITILVAVLYYALGWFGIRRASYPLMIVFVIFMFVDMGAVVAVLTIVVPNSQYQLTRNGLITFCFVQLVINIITLVVGSLNMKDFQKGLRHLLETKHTIILDVDKVGAKQLPRTVPVLD